MVLNKGWVPIHIKSVREAISDVVAGCAKILDHKDKESYLTHDWTSWMTLAPSGDDRIIHMVRNVVRVPEIIVLKDYSDTKHREIKLTRKNVFLRDRYQCQYCGKTITLNSGTIDHVFPKSRGGPNTWDNFVAACFPCNTKKKNRTPEEAGLKLRSKPIKPKWYPLSTRLSPGVPESWSPYLPDKSKLPSYFTETKV